MDNEGFEQELIRLEGRLKELIIRFEQYFAGVEKREPQQERTRLARDLRQLTTMPMFQTGLRFRYQNLAQKFYTYGQQWDRTLRLIDEGRYHRHTRNIKSSASSPPQVEKPELPLPTVAKTSEELFTQLINARKLCGVDDGKLTPRQVQKFLQKQNARVRERFGDRAVEFVVDCASGTPQVKVRLKQKNGQAANS